MSINSPVFTALDRELFHHAAQNVAVGQHVRYKLARKFTLVCSNKVIVRRRHAKKPLQAEKTTQYAIFASFGMGVELRNRHTAHTVLVFRLIHDRKAKDILISLVTHEACDKAIRKRTIPVVHTGNRWVVAAFMDATVVSRIDQTTRRDAIEHNDLTFVPITVFDVSGLHFNLHEVCNEPK